MYEEMAISKFNPFENKALIKYGFEFSFKKLKLNNKNTSL